MIAFDTNLLIRLATNDAPAERTTVIQLMDNNPVFIPITVILESEWVLRSRYDFTTEHFCQFLSFLLELPNVTLDRAEAVIDAINAHRQGLDFADALHATLAAPFELLTFDKKFVAKAQAQGRNVALANRM